MPRKCGACMSQDNNKQDAGSSNQYPHDERTIDKLQQRKNSQSSNNLTSCIRSLRVVSHQSTKYRSNNRTAILMTKSPFKCAIQILAMVSVDEVVSLLKVMMPAVSIMTTYKTSCRRHEAVNNVAPT